MDSIYKKYFLKIINKYNKGIATEQEIKFLESFDNAFDLQKDLITDENEIYFQDVKSAIKKAVDNRLDLYDKKRLIYFRSALRYAAAAIILLSVSVAIFWVEKHNSRKQENKQIAQEIHPGGNKATLTLSNGSRIVLDDARNGQIAKQSNINITKTAGNQIVYAPTANSAGGNGQLAYQLQNTISTPNGGQYQLILPDGTKVMLNAATSLTYPAAFHGGERLVHLNGEAYFEVAKNKKMPFRVVSGMQTVEVLGTHFNINAYTDEPAVKTTLLEGSVKVSSGTNSVLIVPGEQAVTNINGSDNILKHPVDVDEETAWKNGLFSFQNNDLKYVMRQVARWYDVKVVYVGNLPTERFIGEISRTSNLSDVFKILELNDVHFEVQGKTVIVSAKR
jgi:ferric-dicitrate binding protein FerR (iron transport regulator)